MASVLIVYASDWGNTRKMAEAVADGVRSVAGSTPVLKTAEEAVEADLVAADAVIIGSPVHMGSPDWRVKKFMDAVCSGLWMKNGMLGKVGAVFATGSGFGNTGGGAELTLLTMLSNLAELGMILCPLPKSTPGYNVGGLQWGPWGRSMGENMEQTGLPAERTVAAKEHGANVARLADALKGKTVFPK